MDSLQGLRIVAYARFSSDNQRDTSIDDQVRVAREFLARWGGALRDEFILTDYAVSGVSKARDGFERLLRLIETRAVDLVVTESASRLSRDLGDADRLYKLCEFHGVRLICISEGVDSARDGARMQFQMNAMMSDQYLVKLGKETLRGLRGAAERGHCTGGLPYGYVSRAVWNGGREPDHYEIVIDAERSATVVRIFEMYAAGKSYLSIAKLLNDEEVPPPRSGAKSPSKFWKKGTIREMLANAAYVGRWTFGKKQWRKDPVTRKRRYVFRNEGVQVDDRPHLRVVPEELWELVRARRGAVRENYSGAGTGAPGHRTKHPFSGLLFCGLCGHRFVDGGGSSCRVYRCSAATTGGACANVWRVREDVLLEAAVGELRRVLFQTDLREQLTKKIEARLATFKVKSNDERVKMEKALVSLDAEAARLVTFIRTTDLSANAESFEVVRASLDETMRKQRDVRAKLSGLKAATTEPRIPTVEEITAYVLDIEARLRDDPTTAREALRRVLLDGKIVLHPQPDGTWRAESMLVVGVLAGSKRKPRSGGPSGASETSPTSSSEVVEIGCCAGWN